MGDFNDSIKKMDKLARKLNLSTCNLGNTRQIQYANKMQSSRLDGIWSTEPIIESSSYPVNISDHFLIGVTVNCDIKK